ncbi:MAG TPA: tRNA pseudouridine(38-40) synthase TruA, partial [Actinomycetales bacterium]|nr:tRNA pseudouridine(38-40) synthase TruA [Actinomycetales bacterium]
MRIRLDIRYDGSNFAGWAIQPNLRTIQGELEAALGKIFRTDPPRLIVAGRTDASVHARGQVAHFDIASETWSSVVGQTRAGQPPRKPEAALLSRLRGVLPADLVVTGVQQAPVGFDARFSALMRHYIYQIVDDVSHRDPLRRAEVLWHRRALDVEKMNAAAGLLVGRHDFAAFCRPRPGATTIRTLTTYQWERSADGLAVATVSADAFCHSMVRALVGACIPVGEGKQSVEWPRELLRNKKRDAAVTVVPGHGLTLAGVDYPPDDELAARATQTRARRAAHDVDAYDTATHDVDAYDTATHDVETYDTATHDVEP